MGMGQNDSPPKSDRSLDNYPERTVTYSQDFLRIIVTLCYAFIKQFKLGDRHTKT
ncbi:hypothetical protein RintRC_3849 [Richelia intracellularis]|nr:hypothetical protein RintRC_3849 [Richelia intracellularis]